MNVVSRRLYDELQIRLRARAPMIFLESTCSHDRSYFMWHL